MKPKEYTEQMVSRFVDSIEKHGKDWVKPWVGKSGSLQWPVNGSTGLKYSGCNVFGLMIDGAVNGYTSNKWGTFKQWKALGRHVPKGPGGRVLKYGVTIDDDKDKAYQWAKIYPVWNECQLLDYEEPEAPEPTDCKVIKHRDIEDFVAALGSDVQYHGNRACYNTLTDIISMPESHKFLDTKDATATQNFYSTLLHEHVHWTGHKSRLDRDLKGASFRKSYAYEELIAELGSVLLAVEFELEPEPTADHAKYLNNWLDGLKDNPKALISAMADAQKAVAFMHKARSEAMMKVAAE